MTAISELEPYVSTCVDLFLKRIDEVTDGGKKSIDISPWMQYYAFDVLGEVNFGRQLGFLKSGTDVDQNIEGIETVLKYVSLVEFSQYLAECESLIKSCRLGKCRVLMFSCWVTQSYQYSFLTLRKRTKCKR